jgi:hypothetical protein
MRRLLGVLRSEQPAERAPQPDLGDLDALLTTARHAGMDVELTVTGRDGGRSGQDGRDGRSGRPVVVPATVGTSAYRIIQESLTNAGRHAPGAPVRIRLDRGPDALRIEVVNGPATGADPTSAGHAGPPGQDGLPGQAGQAGQAGQTGQTGQTGQVSRPGRANQAGQPGQVGVGHGLVGMRERAVMLGGTIDAGPAPGGGFRVVAVLPLTGGGPDVEPVEPGDRTGHTDRTDHGGGG